MPLPLMDLHPTHRLERIVWLVNRTPQHVIRTTICEGLLVLLDWKDGGNLSSATSVVVRTP